MVIVEEKRDGYDLVLHIPQLKQLSVPNSSTNMLAYFILALSVSAGFGAAFDLVWISFAGFVLALGLFAYTAVFTRGNRKQVQGQLLTLENEVASIVSAETTVSPKERIRLGVGRSDFIVKQLDGEEQFWDVIPLDDEGRIGLKSRFQPQHQV